ncbi:phosphatidate cytidylyltransferase [Acidithiobacillus sp. AMEEHan]|uniref:phosphatidate cytidylyltransferase n=1 Tax=Acidithiobacillus sp. AMEEHan TaxID=2994951 RepID=UPI0027E4358E|nr:phosphatidate cytidylyltransferase [Acidithiobacillus sp. AMEEHan]
MRQRLITAFALLAFFVPLLLYGNRWLFLLVLTLFLGLAAREWAYLTDLRRPALSALLVAIVLLAAGSFWPMTGLWPALVAVPGVAFWLLALALLARVMRRGVFASRWLRWAALPVLLPAFWLAVYLQARHPILLLWGLAIVIMTDVLAMLAGKRLGKTRLVPRLSPGKTWAGLWGGLLGGALVGTLGAGWLWSWQPLALLSGTGVGLVVAAFAVLGDLFESLLKRAAGKKDSGQLLPGHGGILDRIDAMTAGLPVFVSLLIYWGKV